MSEIGETFKELKELRKEYKASNPRCTQCGNQLSISRFLDGKKICQKCEGQK